MALVEKIIYSHPGGFHPIKIWLKYPVGFVAEGKGGAYFFGPRWCSITKTTFEAATVGTCLPTDKFLTNSIQYALTTNFSAVATAVGLYGHRDQQHLRF